MSAGHAAADELRIAVATNFAATMSALIERFEELTGHNVLASSGSTGGHYAQIRNGAPFDAFFAADDERPRLLEEQGLTVPGSRFRYAVGRLALWSPQPGYVDEDGRVLEAGNFRFLAIANPDVAPYGAAARDVLMARGLWETLQSRLVRGQDIGQAYQFVATGNAELGFVAWAQLARQEPEVQGSYWLVPDSLHEPIVQEAVLLEDVPAARAFATFVQSPEARDIIRSYGYGYGP
ncbi:MAG TPA: molybdate ABC transporter substrate-binding protein [Gammaproteobacteria bacterium]